MKIPASVKFAAALALVAAPIAAKQIGVDLDPSITGAAPDAPRSGTKVGYFAPKGTPALPVRDPYAKQVPAEPFSEEARPSSEILVETFKLSERVFPDMPTPRANAAAVAFGPGFYVMGGESGGKVLNSFEFYGPGSGKWTTLDPMPTARTMLAAAVIGNAIYAIGGSDKKKSLSVVEVYDIQTRFRSMGRPRADDESPGQPRRDRYKR